MSVRSWARLPIALAAAAAALAVALPASAEPSTNGWGASTVSAEPSSQGGTAVPAAPASVGTGVGTDGTFWP
jgi:hypothetical protein